MKKIASVLMVSIMLLGMTTGCETEKQKRKKEIERMRGESEELGKKIEVLDRYLELCEKGNDC